MENLRLTMRKENVDGIGEFSSQSPAAKLDVLVVLFLAMTGFQSLERKIN